MLHYTRLERLASDKDTSLLSQFLSNEENEVLRIRTLTYSQYLKGEPKKKPTPRLAFVINQPTMVQTYTCEKCHKKFDERCHLVTTFVYFFFVTDALNKYASFTLELSICKDSVVINK